MKPIRLPAPCHLCGQTCVSVSSRRVARRLDRADFGQTAERAGADACPWRQCPHQPDRRVPIPVIEDQTSFAIVAAPRPPRDRPPVVVSLHPIRDAAETDRERLLLVYAARSRRRTASHPRIDYDVIEFPHAVIASLLDAAQEEGYEYGYEHGRETAREDFAKSAESGDRTGAALRDLAERNPRLFADTVAYLTGVQSDLATAAVESVRLGHGLDEPLMRALEASATAGRTP